MPTTLVLTCKLLLSCHAGWGESGDGTVNGISTNMHITSSLVDGPVPKELCIIPTLREHDFGGQLNRGHLTGTVHRPCRGSQCDRVCGVMMSSGSMPDGDTYHFL